MTSSIVGSPAWAPREGDPLGLADRRHHTRLRSRAGRSPASVRRRKVFTADGDTPSPGRSDPGRRRGKLELGRPPTPSDHWLGRRPERGPVTNHGLAAHGRLSPTTAGPKAGTGGPSCRCGFSRGASRRDHRRPRGVRVPRRVAAAGSLRSRQVWPFGMQSSPGHDHLADAVRLGRRRRAQPRRLGGGAQAGVPRAARRHVGSPRLAADTLRRSSSRRHLYPWKARQVRVTSVVTSAVLPLARTTAAPGITACAASTRTSPVPRRSSPGRRRRVRITGDVFVIVKGARSRSAMRRTSSQFGTRSG